MIAEKKGRESVVQSRVSGKERGLKWRFLDTTNLVRSIQRAEGNPDCFRKAEEYCDRFDCSWRLYCLIEEGSHPEEGM